MGHSQKLHLPLPSLSGGKTAGSRGRSRTQDSAGFLQARNQWSGMAYFSPRCGYMPAGMGEHQLTIRDYLQHANLYVTNKYLQAASQTKRQAQEKLVDAILPSGPLSKSKSNLVQ
jgi:hypothetical protein